MKKQEAQKIWWYRLIKVIFLMLIVISIGSFFVISIEIKPEIDNFESRYSTKCADGRILGDYGGYDMRSKLELSKNFYRGYSYEELKDFENFDKIAKIGCKNLESLSSEDFKKAWESGEVIEKNYEIIRTKTVYSYSWYSFIFNTILALVLIALFFSLIRAIFLYVFFDEKFWRNMIWRKNI